MQTMIELNADKWAIGHPPEGTVESTFVLQFFDPFDSKEFRPLKVIGLEPMTAICVVELLHTSSHCPLRSEIWQYPGDLFAIDLVATSVGATALRILDDTSRYYLPDNLCDISDSVVLFGSSNVKCLVVN